MEVVQLTEDEADARLMIEAGLSLSELSGLTPYWKRLLLGYKEAKVVQENKMEQIRRMMSRMPQSASGWRTPNG